jgi:hypothetical protein
MTPERRNIIAAIRSMSNASANLAAAVAIESPSYPAKARKLLTAIDRVRAASAVIDRTSHLVTTEYMEKIEREADAMMVGEVIELASEPSGMDR